MEDKLKEVAKETEHAIISLAKSVTEDNKPENPEGNTNQPQNGACMETASGIKWIESQKTRKWEIIKDTDSETISLPGTTPPSNMVGSQTGGPSRGGGGGGGRDNNYCVAHSDEPPLPPFPTGNDPLDSSSVLDSYNNHRRCGIGR
jgi:hypothetical protein